MLMPSAAAVLRSVSHVLRRPPFPRVLTGRQPPPPRAQNFSTRRFYSADCTAVGKPAETNTVRVDDALSRKLDEINRVYDETDALLLKYGDVIVENIVRKRRRKALVRGVFFAGGVLATTYYVKQRFFGGTKEDKEMSSTGNN